MEQADGRIVGLLRLVALLMVLCILLIAGFLIYSRIAG